MFLNYSLGASWEENYPLPAGSGGKASLQECDILHKAELTYPLESSSCTDWAVGLRAVRPVLADNFSDPSKSSWPGPSPMPF